MSKNKYKMKNKKVKKAFILDKCFTYAGLFFLLLALLVGGLKVLKTKKAIDDMKPFREVISHGGLNDNSAVYLENKAKSEPILIMEEGKNAYALINVLDEYNNDEYFVLRLSKKDLDKLTEKVKSSAEPVRIEGYTIYMDNETLQEKTAEKLVDLFPYMTIEKGRVFGIVGAYYTQKVSDNIALKYFEIGRSGIIAAIVLLVISLILLIVGKRLKKKSISFVAYSETNPVVLDREMGELETQWFDTLGIYATKNYIISIGLRMYVAKYANIQWIYSKEKVLLETNLYDDVVLMDKKGKLHRIARVNWGGTKSGRVRIEMQQLYDAVHKHNGDAFFGYTPELEKMMYEKNNLKYKEPKEKKQ